MIDLSGRLKQVIMQVTMQEADKSGIVCSDFRWIDAIAAAIVREFCVREHFYGADIETVPPKPICSYCGQPRETEVDRE